MHAWWCFHLRRLRDDSNLVVGSSSSESFSEFLWNFFGFLQCLNIQVQNPIQTVSEYSDSSELSEYSDSVWNIQTVNFQRNSVNFQLSFRNPISFWPFSKHFWPKAEIYAFSLILKKNGARGFPFWIERQLPADTMLAYFGLGCIFGSPVWSLLLYSIQYRDCHLD
jgi:hypothetical protein